MFQQKLEGTFQAKSCSWKVKTISQSQTFQAAKVLKGRSDTMREFPVVALVTAVAPVQSLAQELLMSF